MRKHNAMFVLLFSGLLLFGSRADVMASQEIALEKESIQTLRKSISKADPAFYVDITWEVALHNVTDESQVTTVILTLLDHDRHIDAPRQGGCSGRDGIGESPDRRW